jgi:hypothetical protein
MNERQLLKIQKQRHMSDIFIMLLSNPLFKNLSERDQKKMAVLIYKAEMIELHARNQNLARVNTSFKDIIDSINRSLNMELLDELDEDDDFGDDDPFK